MAFPWLELTIIFGFYSLMLAIGFYHYLLHGWEGEYGYFIAAGQLGGIVAGFTYLATIFSMFTFLGAIGGYYAFGITFINLPLFEMLLVAILIPTLGFKFWRISQRYEFVTPSDIMAKRFDGNLYLRIIIAIVMIISMMMLLTVQYIGIGIVLELLTDGVLSFGMVVVLMFLVGGIYIAIGGMRSVAITDTIQGVLLAGGMALILVAVVWHFDMSTLVTTAATENPGLIGAEATLFSSDWIFWVSQGIAFSFGFFLWPQLWIRTYTPNSKHALYTMALLWLIFVTALWFIVAPIIAMAGPIALEEIVDPDFIAVEFTIGYLPTWLAAIILTGAAAASLSTLDSIALTLGSLLSHDVYKPLSSVDWSERREELASRLFAFGIAALGALLVFYGPTGTIAELLVFFAYPAMAGIFPAVVLSMYWKKATANAALISMSVSVVYVFGTWFVNFPTFGLYNGGTAIIIGTVLMIVISLIDSERPDAEVIEAYELR